MSTEAVEHLKELEKLKEIDNEFYKYLEEHGKDLLNPADFVDELDFEGNEYKSEDGPQNEVNLPRLTKERFHDITSDLFLKKSIRSLSFLLSCFRSVTSINTLDGEKVPERVSLEKSKKVEYESKNLKKKCSVKERVANMHIEEPELMLDIIKFTLENIPRLFWFHSSNGRSEEEFLQEASPVCLPKWKKIEKICNVFWQDLGNLILYNCLNSSPNFELMEYVFDKTSESRFIMWLLPNRMATLRFATILSRIWTMNKYMVLKNGSYKVLRAINSSFEGLCSDNAEGKFRFTERNELLNNPIKRHEDFLLLLHRTIGVSALRGVSWKNYVSSKQVVDEYVKLLIESDPKKIYRIAYNTIRKLGSLLRLLFVRISRKSCLTKQKSSSKKEKNGDFEQVYSSIYSWRFLTFIRIWTKAIVSVPHLAPLKYPIIVIITSAVKIKLNSVILLPFTLQCLEILVELASKMRIVIPISEMLFETHATIEKGVKDTHSKQTQNKLKGTNIINTGSKIFIPEFEIKIGNQLLKSIQVFDSIQEYWTHIIVLHISGMKGLYFYPEFLYGIVPTLKKLQKLNSRHWNDQVSLKTKDTLKLAQKYSECLCIERASKETNIGSFDSLELFNSKIKKAKTITNSTKGNDDSSFITPECISGFQDASKEAYNSFNRFIDNEVLKRSEFISSKIKIFSQKSPDKSYTNSNIPIYNSTNQQEDLEFVSLLKLLNKMGKTIDDLKSIGPRQLKKLKKSIKNNVSSSRLSSNYKTPSNLSASNNYCNDTSSKTNSQTEFTNQKDMKRKIRNTQTFNINPGLSSTNNGSQNIITEFKTKDDIEEWDLTLSSDSDN